MVSRRTSATPLRSSAFSSLGGGDFQVRARSVCAELGLALDLERELAGLSGGEAARVALAAILLSRFDLLLLDEPTNDLDFDGLGRLERFLGAYRGALVVVSHDRAFLDRTVDRIAAIEPDSHRLREWAGGWSDYEVARGRGASGGACRVRAGAATAQAPHGAPEHTAFTKLARKAPRSGTRPAAPTGGRRTRSKRRCARPSGSSRGTSCRRSRSSRGSSKLTLRAGERPGDRRPRPGRGRRGARGLSPRPDRRRPCSRRAPLDRGLERRRQVDSARHAARRGGARGRLSERRSANGDRCDRAGAGRVRGHLGSHRRVRSSHRPHAGRRSNPAREVRARRRPHRPPVLVALAGGAHAGTPRRVAGSSA